MLATPKRRSVVAAGAAVYVAAGALLYATGHAAVHAASYYASGPLTELWLPVLAAMLLIRLLPWRTPVEAEADQLRRDLGIRHLRPEVVALLGCLLAFHVGDVLLGFALGMVNPAFPALSYDIAKVLFLLIVPMILIGPEGIMRYTVGGPRSARLGLRVPDWWRWAGLVAVAVYMYLALFTPWTSPLPTPYTLPTGYALWARILLAFADSVVLGEIFFRAVLQTRLELLLGRWPGIVVTALVYGVSSAVATHAYPQWWVIVAMGVVAQGSAGLLFGYLWSRYRNLWVNILLHGFISGLTVLPVILSG
ncbi:CPBP family intramembrane glutamic endopeptidase [Marinitenerispora sediminis]|uniref:CAAX protease family protein n=1 Tax=Marinitenerispora sediminis TaxID=1931232 RepID=A0A368T8Q5_9ACTN|nr:type II CAAX endopeptidase family protein [Marinitenerispora sediminis]RCV52037.1 CAAX protease family protein [Marinitenerispora sediminis]RCV54694.1 CAAX protease family protein [Marinitenerispora sediminis]RCV60382.1 CAAX protease family protein [Marinitenerispora sediminis]